VPPVPVHGVLVAGFASGGQTGRSLSAIRTSRGIRAWPAGRVWQGIRRVTFSSASGWSNVPFVSSACAPWAGGTRGLFLQTAAETRLDVGWLLLGGPSMVRSGGVAVVVRRGQRPLVLPCRYR
jgi:hypothetical protein